MLKRILAALAVLTACSAVGAATGSTDISSQLAVRGLILTAFGVFLAGVGVSLTPCVYPMIPITLSIIGARTAGQKAILGFLHSFVFVLGIALVYSILGIIVARSDSRTMGFLFQQTWFVVVIALFFAAMGLSMMGLFTIQAPGWLGGKLQAGANRGGYLGAFLLGMVTGVVASPCGSPVLVSVLLVAAQAGKGIVGFVLLFAYALGIGMLFLILGTFPSLLKALPKSGAWMEDIKRLLGLVLIGVGVYYLRYALPHLAYLILVVGGSLAAALLIAVKSGERRDSPRLLAVWRLTGAGLALFAVAVAFMEIPKVVMALPSPDRDAQKVVSAAKAALAPVVTPQGIAADISSAWKPPAVVADPNGKVIDLRVTPAPVASGSATPTPVAQAAVPTPTPVAQAEAELDWVTSETEGLLLAKSSGKPIIIDFGAEWCAACKELEKKTFPAPEVRKVLEGFVRIRVDCTEESAETEALWKKYGIKSLPAVQFIDKNGDWQKDLTLLTFEPPEEFLKRLEKLAK
jgi:thioredoxin:protein disulfide reductase